MMTVGNTATMRLGRATNAGAQSRTAISQIATIATPATMRAAASRLIQRRALAASARVMSGALIG
jgi:hypothetical protein